jgi:MFS transporter, FSR family, fosmidomycin resistance protein
VFTLLFLILLLSVRSSLKATRPLAGSKGVARASVPQGAYLSMGLLVAAVIMRSWTHFGLMTYIPFYYIDHEKGDPLYAGLLVSAFLAGGAVGTLLGSPMADRFGYKRYLILSLGVTSALFPLIFITHGLLLIVTLGIVGMALISSFTSTIVMAQEILPGNLGVASGLMAGFAIGTGGIGVALLGVIADHWGILTALHCIAFLPIAGVLIGLLIKFPLSRRKEPQTG